jgi:hypothetical protein
MLGGTGGAFLRRRVLFSQSIRKRKYSGDHS